jgi:hypothetical protein
MSAQEGTLRKSFLDTMFWFTTGGMGAGARLRRLEIYEPAVPESTGVADTVNIDAKNVSWLDAVEGAFDNNPLYHRILENEREARRLMDEQFTNQQ